MIESSNAVSVHVRRGDYISNPKTNLLNGECTIEYYERAAKFIEARFDSPHYFIFSDDPDWAVDNIHLNGQTTVVRHNKPEQAHEDLYLMKHCKHHIIANSSFSWWGAWLCENKNKIVVTPKKWVQQKDIDTSDVIPEQWIKL